MIMDHHLLFLFLFLLLYPITLHFLDKLILNLPPTPFPALPFIGHIYYFLFFIRSTTLPLHRVLSKISRRHGPVVFLRLGCRLVLLVSSATAARECFTGSNDVVFANRPDLLNGKHFGYNFTSLAWASYGAHWRNLRRISVLELLSSCKLNMLADVRADESRILIRKLLYRHHDVIDIRKLFFEHTYTVAARMITGRAGGVGKAQAFQEILEEMSRVTMEANVVDFLPLVGWFRDVERKLSWVQEKRDRFMEDLMEECHGMETGQHKTLIHVLWDLQRAEPEYYTDQTIKNLLLVLLQEASHASSNTLEWAFSLLLENPRTLTRARAEIDRLHRLITKWDVSRIPYLRCIIKETLRMHPAAPLLTPHVSSEECSVGGFRIPRGTMLLVNTWDIQNSPAGTWKDPDKFMPERFGGGGGGSDFKFGPFRWGRRACPGENLGMHMVRLALGCLIQCFEWEKEVVGDHDMREGRGVITPKLQPLRATCIPRPFTGNLVS